jgi:hypothetical protein
MKTFHKLFQSFSRYSLGGICSAIMMLIVMGILFVPMNLVGMKYAVGDVELFAFVAGLIGLRIWGKRLSPIAALRFSLLCSLCIFVSFAVLVASVNRALWMFLLQMKLSVPPSVALESLTGYLSSLVYALWAKNTEEQPEEAPKREVTGTYRL